MNHETAKRLVTLRNLTSAMQETQDALVAAAMLGIRSRLVWARLQGPYPSERHPLWRLVEHHEHTTH